MIYILHFSYNVYVMFYCKIPWFYQDFKSKNMFLKSVLSSRCENTGPLSKDHVKSSRMRNETPLQV